MEKQTFTYRDQRVEITLAGHPQVQNIVIEDKAAGFVVFPVSSVERAKSIIDANLA